MEKNTNLAIQPEDRIVGLQKGLRIIESFNENLPKPTIADVARTNEITRSAARRHLLTLAEMGYIETDGKHYWLSTKVLNFANAYLKSSKLPRILNPFLQRITMNVGETAQASVLENDEVVYIAKNSPTKVINAGWDIGKRMNPFLVTAGLVMLANISDQKFKKLLEKYDPKPFTPHTMIDKKQIEAFIENIKTQGYAITSQQYELGVIGAAVPLRDRNGNLLGAISVTAPMARMTVEEIKNKVIPVLTDCSQILREVI
jgi:IclR family pca regulon transcriptional regulator